MPLLKGCVMNPIPISLPCHLSEDHEEAVVDSVVLGGGVGYSTYKWKNDVWMTEVCLAHLVV